MSDTKDYTYDFYIEYVTFKNYEIYEIFFKKKI